MREQHNVAWGQSVPVVATAAALWLSGVVALPLIFGEILGGFVSAVVWLGVALAIAVCLVALLPRLARLLAGGLARLSAALASPDVPSSATFTSPELLVVARLVVLAAELLIVQAVLRRPVALVLGGAREAATVEAGIAAGALTLILLLLVWTYHTTRPLVQAATLRAIDAAIPTIGTVALTEQVTRSTRAAAPSTVRRTPAGDQTERAASDEATRATAPTAEDKTVASPRVADETVVSPHVAAEKASASPPRDGETVVSPRADETVPRGAADETFVSPPRGDEPRARGA